MCLDKMLEYNREFVAKKQYVPYATDMLPNKRMVILTCMESRLVELLPKALNIQNGDVKMLKNAGAIIRRPFDTTTKSILIAIHNLQADVVMVVGHYDCGMSKVNANELIENMVNKGIKRETIDLLERSGIDFHEEFQGFNTVEQSINQSVQVIRHHPLLPPHVRVHGLAIDPSTGEVDVVSRDS